LHCGPGHKRALGPRGINDPPHRIAPKQGDRAFPRNYGLGRWAPLAAAGRLGLAAASALSAIGSQTRRDPAMPWVYLIAAGLFEVGFASTLKLTDGFTKLWPTLIFTVCIVLSFLLLNKAVKDLPIGTAYAIWTGIGAAGTAIVGILVYKEPVTALRLFFIATLIGSIIGLKLATTTT
jgi:quaternary ammonium compound-resistance protein SugE